LRTFASTAITLVLAPTDIGTSTEPSKQLSTHIYHPATCYKLLQLRFNLTQAEAWDEKLSDDMADGSIPPDPNHIEVQLKWQNHRS